MPELPEVETIVRQLRQAVVGQRIARADLMRPDVLRGDPNLLQSLVGQAIEGVDRRAKRIILTLNGCLQLIFHLGMTGRVDLADPRAEVAKHTHLRVGLAPLRRELRFIDPRRFGGVWVIGPDEQPAGRGMGTVGPEPLTLRFTEFQRILDRRAQIKALLMDQRRIAGLGNIYCCEALFRAGIHPLTPASTINEARARRLLREVKKVLRLAIAHQGSTYMDYRTTTGERGSFQRLHRVYHREGLPCRMCQTPIERMPVGGRSTFFCRVCQPLDE